MSTSPYFSIVIPAYNREREIPRALGSCLRQSFRDFEVLVVDDGSTDGTAAAVALAPSSDKRVKLLRHEGNRGVCAARNTGVGAARGEWVLFLDSDDEYLDEALALIHRRTIEAGAAVDRIGFMYRLDTGGLSPVPHPTGQLLDYEGYLRWSENVVLSDFHNCIRRRTFDSVMLPEGRVYESLYHLDFARLFRTRLLPEPVAVIHGDASNRCVNLPAEVLTSRILSEAADGVAGVERLLDVHGKALSQCAPKRFETYRRMRVTFHLLAGNTGRGMLLALRHLLDFPFSRLSWLVPGIGLFGPAALARAQALARRRHAPSH